MAPLAKNRCQSEFELRNLHIHLGPHKTGSTSIQNFLADQLPTDYSSAEDVLYLKHSVVDELGIALQNKNWRTAHNLINRLRDVLLECQAETIVISNEDLAGNLLGRAGTKRIYPRLSENVKLIDDALNDFLDCRFYFFVRKEEDWLRSVYLQNLKHRSSVTGFDNFSSSIRGERTWGSILEKVQKRLGERFTVLSFDNTMGTSAVKSFATAALPNLKFPDETFDSYWFNRAPCALSVGVLEVINRSHASQFAKKNARLAILRENVEQQQVSKSPSPACDKKAQGEEGAVAVWPVMIERPDPFPDDLLSLWNRAEGRIHRQDQPNLLPEFANGFSSIRFSLTEGEERFPKRDRQDMRQQEEILRHRFRGLPLVCFFNAFAISYLRRETPHTEYARDLFFALWEQEHEILLSTLPTRWLISVLQTFMDHGKSEAQRVVGTAGYFFSNTLKAYEAERALENRNPDAIYEHTEPATKNGFHGLDRFALGNTDLMLNLLSLLLETSAREEVSGRVLREFLLRTKSSKTLFSRMDESRLHHDISVRGFDNCWSFFEKPNR